MPASSPTAIRPMERTQETQKGEESNARDCVSVSPGSAAPSASSKQDESSSMQERNERQKRKTILGPLLSKQITANCKESPHTSSQIMLCPTSTNSVAQTASPRIRPFPCHLHNYLLIHVFSSHQVSSLLMLKRCYKYDKKTNGLIQFYCHTDHACSEKQVSVRSQPDICTKPKMRSLKKSQFEREVKPDGGGAHL